MLKNFIVKSLSVCVVFFGRGGEYFILLLNYKYLPADCFSNLNF